MSTDRLELIKDFAMLLGGAAAFLVVFNGLAWVFSLLPSGC